MVYIDDDVLAIGKNFTEHLDNLRKVFSPVASCWFEFKTGKVYLLLVAVKLCTLDLWCLGRECPQIYTRFRQSETSLSPEM